MGRMTLLQLPVELLCHILAFLNGPTTTTTYDLVRVRETCKALKELIDNSEMLQYIIDLCYFRMIHVPGETHETNVTTHRKQLRQHEDAWRTFGYKQKCTLTLQPASTGTIHVVSGILCGSIRGDRIYFVRLSSLSDPDDVHSWSHPIDVEHWLAFTFCPEQDLFVVVTSSQHDESHLFDIHLRSLTTNEVHPNAAYSVLKALDTDNPIIEDFITFDHPEKLRINGNYISLHCRYEQWGYLQMWDWKCREGYQFILPLHDHIDYFFIAEDKLLVSGPDAVDIYSMTDKSKLPQRIVKLSLPSLIHGWSYLDVTATINPIPGSAFLDYQMSSHQHSCFFHPSLDDQLILFHVVIANAMSEREFLFYARQGAILRLESSLAKESSSDECVPWSEWGPQNTTWFLEDCDMQSLYGFRTVWLLHEDPWLHSPAQLCIRDFNPHNICDDGAGGETGRHGRFVRGGTTTTVVTPFTEPLGSALPYREVISEEPFDALETISMDESRILLLKRDDAGIEKVEVLIF